MRKMKKVLSLAMTAAMTASLLTGMGAVTASAKKSDDGKRTKITALLNSTESTEQYQVYDYLLKNFCDEKGIDCHGCQGCEGCDGTARDSRGSY